MRGWALLTSMVLGCSNLTEGAGGVVELEIRTPAATEVEVGETLLLTARALDRDGNPLDLPVTWLSSDPALAVDNTGLVTGVVPGTAQIQASVGSLSSAQIPLTAIARADTLALVGDSVVVVPPGANSAPLVVQLLSFSQTGPLPDRPLIYSVSFPVITVAGASLPNGTVVDTSSTGPTGLDQSITLNRQPVVPAPDTAFVTVRSYRASGADVAGSGQRFIVLFQ